jgi:hypothetical protein
VAVEVKAHPLAALGMVETEGAPSAYQFGGRWTSEATAKKRYAGESAHYPDGLEGKYTA